MAEYCDDGRFRIRRTGPWGSLDHYEPNDPKRLGFAAPQVVPLELRTKWGFRRQEINPGDYSLYTESPPPSGNGYGYTPADLMVRIDHYSNAGATIDACPFAEEFYADEPLTNGGWSMQHIIDVGDHCHLRGKKFGVGEQAWILFVSSSNQTYFHDYVMPHLDFVTYTNYVNVVTGWNQPRVILCWDR